MGLELDALTFQRAGRHILGPLSVRLSAGEMVGVVGPNGSGKSTLLRLLYGYLQPSTGYLSLDGRAISSIEPRELARKLGACPQEAEPSLDFSVDQALALSSGGELALSARRAECFPFLGLARLYGRQISQLSGGERQRVRLGRTMLPQPPWLVLDEPANHLDLATAWALLDHLRQPRQGGVIVALHDLAFAVRFCDKLLVLDRGLMVSFAPPTEALSRQVLSQVFGLLGHVDPETGLCITGVVK